MTDFGSKRWFFLVKTAGLAGCLGVYARCRGGCVYARGRYTMVSMYGTAKSVLATYVSMSTSVLTFYARLHFFDGAPPIPRTKPPTKIGHFQPFWDPENGVFRPF